jgi:hypothetical protein
MTKRVKNQRTWFPELSTRDEANAMNGAELLIKTAAAGGIDICFTNPGTTELPLVEAFDKIKGFRPVLGLFEGCCSGAADGYARMAGKPAMTLFHLGPGLGNAIANLHNAERAGSPVLNIIGDHATWHRDADAPLTMDIEALSKTVSDWTRTSTSIETLPHDIARAMAVANKGSIATLIVPQDVQWAETSQENISKINHEPVQVDMDFVQHVAKHLRNSKKAVIILGGSALRGNGLRAAARIMEKTHCNLLSETFPAHMERGVSLPAIDRIPYAPSFASEILSRYDCIVLAGAKEPVAFFGYQDEPSRLLSAEQKVIRLSSDKDNLQESLKRLADFLGAPPYAKFQIKLSGSSLRPHLPAGALGPKKASATGKRHRGGRIHYLGRRLLQHDGNRAPVQPPNIDRRRHRSGNAVRRGRSHCLSRQSGHQFSSRRECHVYRAVFVDAGKGKPEYHDPHLRQSTLQNSRKRTCPHRQPNARCIHKSAYESGKSRHRLGQSQQGNGCAGGFSPDSRRAGTPPRIRSQGTGPLFDRNETLTNKR